MSRACCVIIKSRTNANMSGSTQAAADSYASDPWQLQGIRYDDTTTAITATNRAMDGTMTAFQVQLGAQYIPALPTVSPQEFLHSALKTFNQYRRSDEVGGVPLWSYMGIDEQYSFDNARPDQVRAAKAISAVPLESSSTLQQSGSAISAQRTAVVNFEYKYDRTTDTPRRVDLFVPYSKLATLYLDSVVVRS